MQQRSRAMFDGIMASLSFPYVYYVPCNGVFRCKCPFCKLRFATTHPSNRLFLGLPYRIPLIFALELLQLNPSWLN